MAGHFVFGPARIQLSKIEHTLVSFWKSPVSSNLLVDAPIFCRDTPRCLVAVLSISDVSSEKVLRASSRESVLAAMAFHLDEFRVSARSLQ